MNPKVGLTRFTISKIPSRRKKFNLECLGLCSLSCLVKILLTCSLATQGSPNYSKKPWLHGQGPMNEVPFSNSQTKMKVRLKTLKRKVVSRDLTIQGNSAL